MLVDFRFSLDRDLETGSHLLRWCAQDEVCWFSRRSFRPRRQLSQQLHPSMFVSNLKLLHLHSYYSSLINPTYSPSVCSVSMNKLLSSESKFNPDLEPWLWHRLSPRPRSEMHTHLRTLTQQHTAHASEGSQCTMKDTTTTITQSGAKVPVPAQRNLG